MNWSNHVAIVVDGILRQSGDPAIIIPGLMLYKSLVKDHKVSLIIDSAAKEKVQYWLITNGLTEHTREIYWEVGDPEEEPERRLAQVGRLRSEGPLGVIYESNTEAAAKLYEHGIPCFLYLHPTYTHPEFRPGFSSEPTPWNALLAEKVRQQEARATDTRLTDIF